IFQRAVGGGAEGADGYRLAADVAGLVRLARGVQAVDLLEVEHRLDGVVAVAVAGAEGFGPARAGRADSDFLDARLAQFALEAVNPAAARLLNSRVQRRGVWAGVEIGRAACRERVCPSVLD